MTGPNESSSCRSRLSACRGGMLGVSTVRRTVEPRHDRLVAAIGHVVHEATVTAIEIDRLQDPEVALILDVPVRVACSPVEVDDASIQVMCWVEFANIVPCGRS